MRRFLKRRCSLLFIILMNIIVFVLLLAFKDIFSIIFLMIALFAIYILYTVEKSLFDCYIFSINSSLDTLTLKIKYMESLLPVIKKFNQYEKTLLLSKYKSIYDSIYFFKRNFNLKDKKNYFEKIEYIIYVKKKLDQIYDDSNEFINDVKVKLEKNNKSNYNDYNKRKNNKITNVEWALNLLKLDKNATDEDIKKTYRVLAKKYHPDVNNGKDENFKLLIKAYEILKNR